MDASGAVARPQVVGLTAVEIAALVRSGEVSAEEVTRAHLDRIAEVDPRIDAFRVVREEAALLEARAVDSALTRFALPLAGVPVAVKDNVAVKGEVATDGVAGRAAGEPAARHHPVVDRLRKAGAVVVGITRVPELCLYSATDGPGTTTRNPWDTGAVPGGQLRAAARPRSPPGACRSRTATTAWGPCAFPRPPAGWSPSSPGRGVVPAGIGADSWSGMSENGVLATTVADLALAHAVLAGTDPAPPAAPGRPLRIAVSTRSPIPGVRADAATPAGRRRHGRGAARGGARRLPRRPGGAAPGRAGRHRALDGRRARRRRAPRPRPGAAAAAQPHARPHGASRPAGAAVRPPRPRPSERG